jgi:hypothetical protein
MKKLLVLLLISIMAIFVFAGCDGTTTPPANGDEGEEEVGVCPEINITGSFADPDSGWTYVKGGKLTVEVVFDQPTEGASIYLAGGVFGPFDVDRAGVWDILLPSVVSEDKTTYTAVISKSLLFDVTGEDCDAFTILVEGCDVCACMESFKADWAKPFIGPVEVCMEDCACEGCSLTFTGKKTADLCGSCGDPKVYCNDCCSGFAGYSIALYDSMPFDECCDTPCAEPIDSGSGDCQVDWTSVCLTEPAWDPGTRTVWALITALDNVGNKTKWLARIVIGYDTDGSCVGFNVINAVPGSMEPWDNCVDTPEFSACISG